MAYGFRVVFPTQGFLDAKGFSRVAHLPFIMDERPGYHRLGNQFLIDRALGKWEPTRRGKQETYLSPSTVSLKNYADWLANFLEWCLHRKKDLLTVDYKIDLIQQYQGEMIKGIWSRDNVGLKPNTINARVSAAVDFLTWAADKGLREQLYIPKVLKAYIANNPASSIGHLSKSVESRKWKLPGERQRYVFPTDSEIFAWLQRLSALCPTEGLIAETILETAVRRAEAAAWRIDTLPLNPRDWRVVNPEKSTEHQAVLVELSFNTKGREYGQDHGDKIGPRGTILVPMPLAHKLHQYREQVRPRALTPAIRKAKTRAEAERIRNETVHLFLKPSSGSRYTGPDIYESWRRVERPKGWSPHLARHFWACSILWRHIQQHKALLERALQLNAEESVLKTLQLQAESCIQLTIRPQLRHVSQETTMIYLQWLSDRLGVNMNFHQNWNEQLSQDVDIGENE